MIRIKQLVSEITLSSKKRFKSLTIYTGYGEYSFVDSNPKPFILEGGSLEEVTEKEAKEQEEIGEENGADPDDGQYGNYDMFDGETASWVGAGDEEIIIILAPGNEWYDLVDNINKWNKKTYQKWKEYIMNGEDGD